MFSKGKVKKRICRLELGPAGAERINSLMGFCLFAGIWIHNSF